MVQQHPVGVLLHVVQEAVGLQVGGGHGGGAVHDDDLLAGVSAEVVGQSLSGLPAGHIVDGTQVQGVRSLGIQVQGNDGHAGGLSLGHGGGQGDGVRALQQNAVIALVHGVVHHGDLGLRVIARIEVVDGDGVLIGVDGVVEGQLHHSVGHAGGGDGDVGNLDLVGAEDLRGDGQLAGLGVVAGVGLLTRGGVVVAAGAQQSQGHGRGQGEGKSSFPDFLHFGLLLTFLCGLGSRLFLMAAAIKNTERNCRNGLVKILIIFSNQWPRLFWFPGLRRRGCGQGASSFLLFCRAAGGCFDAFHN